MSVGCARPTLYPFTRLLRRRKPARMCGGLFFCLNVDRGRVTLRTSRADTRRSKRMDSNPSEPKIPGRVLVVDDNKELTSVMARLLVHEGYEVDVAHDGLSALAAIEKRRPDLVVLDVVMPTPDGFEVC